MVSPTVTRRAAVGTIVVGVAGCLSTEDTEPPDGDQQRDTGDGDGNTTGTASQNGTDATATDHNESLSHPAELGSPLDELLEAEDPQAVAESREIPYDDGLDAVEVVITTEPDRDVPAELVVSTGVSTDTDRGVATGVTVSPDKLRSLAEHPNVTQVRPAGVPEDD